MALAPLRSGRSHGPRWSCDFRSCEPVTHAPSCFTASVPKCASAWRMRSARLLLGSRCWGRATRVMHGFRSVRGCPRGWNAGSGPGTGGTPAVAAALSRAARRVGRDGGARGTVRGEERAERGCQVVVCVCDADRAPLLTSPGKERKPTTPVRQQCPT